MKKVIHLKFLSWGCKNFLLVCAMLMFNLVCLAQQPPYRVGFSKVSIEPPASIFSLSLAGYGAPAEGRFSITWDKVDTLKTFRKISSYRNKLIALGKDGNWNILETESANPRWINAPSHIKDEAPLVFIGKNSFQLDENGILFGSFGKKRKTIIKSPKFRLLVSNASNLYAVDFDDQVWVGGLSENNIDWRTIGKEDNIVALAIKNGEFFFTDSLGKMWKRTIQSTALGEKKQIARQNGFTYKLEIKAMAVAGDRLYALDSVGTLLISNHKTNGTLEVGAMAVQRGKKNIVIVTLDLCGIDVSFTGHVKQLLFKKHHLADNDILINASHTHFAPVTQAWTTWADFYQNPDTNYLYQVVAKNIVKAVDQALDAMEPASIFFGRGETNIGVNRDAGRKNLGPVDKTLDVIKVINRKNTVIGTLFSAGCHPVFQNRGDEAFTLSANYPAVARQELSKAIGSVNNLFVQGCAGDINPRSADYRQTGKSLAKDVLKILSKDMARIDGSITSFVDSVLIPIEPMPLDSVRNFRAQNLALKPNVTIDKNIRWADLMETRYRSNKLRKQMPIYFQTLNIGSWKLVGLSREAVTSYASGIRNIWPNQIVSVAGYCNDVSSYLPDQWHIKNRVYEGYDSFFWYGQEGIPPMNIQELILNKIKSTNR